MCQFSVEVTIWLFIAAAENANPSEFHEPTPVQFAGQPLDVELSGHAAPFFGDFDGDGLRDLLVGEFYKGRLRVYKNIGDENTPRFDNFTVFHDGRLEGRVPIS